MTPVLVLPLLAVTELAIVDVNVSDITSFEIVGTRNRLNLTHTIQEVGLTQNNHDPAIDREQSKEEQFLGKPGGCQDGEDRGRPLVAEEDVGGQAVVGGLLEDVYRVTTNSLGKEEAWAGSLG